MADEPAIMAELSIKTEDPGARGGIALRLSIADLLDDYQAVLRRDTAGDAWDWVERLAALWRRGAELSGLERFGDDFLPDDVVELVAAVDSSMVLFGLDDPRRTELGLDVEELSRRTSAVGHRLWPDWDRQLDATWREHLRRAGRPDTDRPDDWPPVPAAIRRPRRSKREAHRLAEEQAELFVAACQLYPRLDADGRTLTGAERQEMLSQIRAIAVIDREVDRQSAMFSVADWQAGVIQLAELRSIRRSLALMLSTDPERRRLAMTLPQFRERLFLAQQRITGASWDEALAALHDLVADHPRAPGAA